MFWLSGEFAAKLLLLRRDSDGAAVEVAVAALDASERDEHRGAERELVRAEHRGDHDVASGAELSVDLELHAVAQVVLDERLVRLGKADFPGEPRVLHRRERRGARSAVEAGDDDHVRMRLRDARGDRPDARLGDELHRDARGGVRALEVVDELREVLDRVDVVVRRRRDERRAGLRVPQARDELVHLVRRELSALARLRALRELDLQVLRAAQVLDRHAEASGRHLLDGAVLLRAEALGVFAALAGVGHRAESVEGECDRLVRLRGKRAQRHRPAHEVLHDRVYRLDTFYTLYMFYTAKLKLRPERHMAVLVDVVGIAVEARVVAVPHRLAEVDEPLRRPEMLLAALARTVRAAGRQCLFNAETQRRRGRFAATDLSAALRLCVK